MECRRLAGLVVDPPDRPEWYSGNRCSVSKRAAQVDCACYFLLALCPEYNDKNEETPTCPDQPTRNSRSPTRRPDWWSILRIDRNGILETDAPFPKERPRLTAPATSCWLCALNTMIRMKKPRRALTSQQEIAGVPPVGRIGYRPSWRWGDPTQPKPRPAGLAFLFPKPLEKLAFLTALENKKAVGLSTNGFVCVVGAAGFEPAAPCSQSRCANRTAPRPEYVCLRR